MTVRFFFAGLSYEVSSEACDSVVADVTAAVLRLESGTDPFARASGEMAGTRIRCESSDPSAASCVSATTPSIA